MLSPLFLRLNGIDRQVQLTGVAVGDTILLGFPADMSGEIAMSLRERDRARKVNLIGLSFAGDYIGYVSPDEYYDELRDERGIAYETGIMSWAGPKQEEYFTTLANRLIAALVR